MRDFFDSIWQFFTVDVWDYAAQFFQWCVDWLKIKALESATASINAIQEALGSSLLTTNVFALLDQHFVNLPDNLVAYLTILRVQEAIMMMLAAYSVLLTIRFFKFFLPFANAS